MAEVSAALVKELRELTGAAMMDCKRALVETEGQIDDAIDLLRKAGQAKADKKTDRIAAEGIVVMARSADGRKAVLLEMNSETDFVARADEFKALAEAVAQAALTHTTDDLSMIENLKLPSGETIDEARRNLISKLGEKIQIRRISLLANDAGVVGAYIHGGRIGVLVNLNVPNDELAKDIAMHIAAAQPLVLAPSDVSADVIAKEKEIYAAQAASSGKPPEIVAKMIDGRIKKYLDEISLSGQAFVKDPEITVGQLLEKNKAQVIQFERLCVGEGIEKKVDNFVEEVMAQARGG